MEGINPHEIEKISFRGVLQVKCLRNSFVSSHFAIVTKCITLCETEAMLHMQGVTLSRYDVLQLYMAVGGIPMYLSYVEPELSLALIIDKMYYARKAKLKNEFNRLFNSIFRSPDRYIATIRMLAKLHKGYSREEISKKIKITGKDLTKLLRTLEVSDFIERYKPFENDNRHQLYRLVDPFCLFYLTQVERDKTFLKTELL